MRSMLSVITLSLLAMTVAAAESYEHFVLSDGRQLVGTHDAAQGRLYLAGPITASVRVAPEAIVSRRPATSAEIPPATESAESTDPTGARIARLRASIRGYERAAQARAVDRDGLTRRVAEGMAVMAELQQRHELLTAEVAALQPERHRVQLMRDEVEQARALTELRVVALTATTIADEHATVVATTISELTTELTAARRRSADLGRELVAIDTILSQRHAALAEIHARALRQRKEGDELERRLARYDLADQDGATRREQLVAVLAHVEAEETLE